MPRQLTSDEVNALRRFAANQGRRWKAILAETYWCNARVWSAGEPNDGHILHALRNDPNWSHDGLKRVKLNAEVLRLSAGIPMNNMRDFDKL